MSKNPITDTESVVRKYLQKNFICLDKTIFVFLIISDAQIIEISRQTLVSALDSNRSQDLHLSLRLSVCEGVKVMYHSYKNKKWSQVSYIPAFIRSERFEHLYIPKAICYFSIILSFFPPFNQ